MEFAHHHAASAAVGDSQGEMAVQTPAIGIEIGTFSLSYARSEFDWENRAALPYGNGVDDPWRGLHELELQGSLPIYAGKKWLAMGFAGASLGPHQPPRPHFHGFMQLWLRAAGTD